MNQGKQKSHLAKQQQKRNRKKVLISQQLFWGWLFLCLKADSRWLFVSLDWIFKLFTDSLTACVRFNFWAMSVIIRSSRFFYDIIFLFEVDHFILHIPKEDIKHNFVVIKRISKNVPPSCVWPTATENWYSWGLSNYICGEVVVVYQERETLPSISISCSTRHLSYIPLAAKP